MLTVAQLNNKGYRLEFNEGFCRIIGKLEDVIATSEQTRVNLFLLNSTVKSCLIARLRIVGYGIRGSVMLTLII